MPLTEQGHRDQHDENKAIAQYLEAAALGASANADALRRWAWIAIFYAAVHWSQAALMVKHNVYPQNHDDRNKELLKHYGSTRGYLVYMRLKQHSEWARYHGIVPSAADPTQAWTDLQDVEHHIV